MSLLLLLLACDPASHGDVFLDAVVTDVSTVVRVTWEAPEDAETWVTYTAPTGVLAREDGVLMKSGDWEALLLATASTVLDYQIWVDGEIASSGSVETGTDEADVDVSSQQAGFDQPMFTTVQNGGDWTPVLFDERGNIRWFREVNDEISGMVSLRARPVEDGVWTSYFSTDVDESVDARLELVAWDGTVLESVPAPYHHHDFWVHDDGTLVWIAFENVELEGGSNTIDALWTRSPEGEISKLCTLQDLLPHLTSGLMPGEPWSWANHLDFDGQSYWLSLNHQSMYLRIGRDGALTGIFGESGDLEPPTWRPDDPFSTQHGGNFGPEGTFLVFDNEGADQGMRVVEYDLDEHTGEGTKIWELAGPENWESPALGDIQRFESGSSAISWGVFGLVEQVDLEGQVEASLELEAGQFIGFLTPTDLP